MAVSFVAAGTGVQNTISTVTLTITKPVGLAVGDLMVAFLGVRDTGKEWTELSGWTETVELDESGGSNGGTSSVQWRVADAGDVAASNFTFTSNSTTRKKAGGIMAFQGFDTTTPIPTYTTKSSNNDPSWDAVTVPQDGCMVVGLTRFTAAGGMSSLTPSGTERFDVASSSSNLTAAAGFTDPKDTGSSGGYSASVADFNMTGCVLLVVQPPTPTGTMTGDFGGLTATMTGTPLTPVLGTMGGTFGGLTATMSGSVVTLVTGTMAGTFGALSGTMAGTVSGPVHGVLAGTFGGLTASMSGKPYNPAITYADLLPSPWTPDNLPSEWRADLAAENLISTGEMAGTFGGLTATMTGSII